MNKTFVIGSLAAATVIAAFLQSEAVRAEPLGYATAPGHPAFYSARPRASRSLPTNSKHLLRFRRAYTVTSLIIRHAKRQARSLSIHLTPTSITLLVAARPSVTESVLAVKASHGPA